MSGAASSHSAADSPTPARRPSDHAGAGSVPALPGAEALIVEMERAVREAQPPPATGPAVAGLVLELVRSNLRQWDLEDATRDPHANDATVAAGKRAIDQLNLGRHRLVQQIDAAFAAALRQPASATLATETPGMVLDRLSVLVIRRARTEAAAARDGRYGERLAAVDGQLSALSEAFDAYLQELHAGTRRFVSYEHLKLYADASASPLSPG